VAHNGDSVADTGHETEAAEAEKKGNNAGSNTPMDARGSRRHARIRGPAQSDPDDRLDPRLRPFVTALADLIIAEMIKRRTKR
jgi:hypothetical protein